MIGTLLITTKGRLQVLWDDKEKMYIAEFINVH